MRRRVKEAQAFIGAAEFGKVDLSYRIGDGPEIVVFCEESVKHRMHMESGVVPGPAPPSSEVLPAPDPKDVSSKSQLGTTASATRSAAGSR